MEVLNKSETESKCGKKGPRTIPKQMHSPFEQFLETRPELQNL